MIYSPYMVSEREADLGLRQLVMRFLLDSNRAGM